MLTPSQIVQAICPPLYASPIRDTFLELASEDLSSGYFGTNYNKAVALKASHIFTLAQRTLGEAGTVASKGEGGLSMSFQNARMASNNDDLDQTHYGKQLRNLARQQSPSASVIGRPELYQNPDMTAEMIAQQAITGEEGDNV